MQAFINENNKYDEKDTDMENLIFSLNATVPVFLVIIAGYIFKKTGLLSDEFIKVANKFNFRVT